MCGFYPFSSSLILSYPHLFLNGHGWHFHTRLFNSFILFTSLMPPFPHCITHPRPTSFLSPLSEWTCACFHRTLLFWSMISCVWLVTPSPPPLPLPSYFAKGAYALGAWSGYSSAGGGDRGEALLPPCCFRIALGIKGQHFAPELDCSRLVP